MNRAFEHLEQILQFPSQAATAQDKFNKDRMAFVERVARFRPHFLPVQHTLPIAAQTMPISETTDQLNHDVIVHGAITDGESRNIRFYRDIEARSLVRYGNESGLNLSLDAIAGHSVASAGYFGPADFPEPFLLPSGQFLTVEMFQQTSPGTTELISTVFTALRVYAANYQEAVLSPDVRAAVDRYIKARTAPETRYAVVKVDFDASGDAVAESPKSDEPMIIIGFRSTFTDATVNFGFDGDNSFAKSKFPIWALCSEPNNGSRLFQPLKRPLFVPPNQKLLFSLKNTIDGSLIATDGNIEILMRTV